MRLQQMSISNFRLFGNQRQYIVFNEDKPITVLLGNNGSGKTSVLDAISISLSTFLSPFPGLSQKNYKLEDVHIESSSRIADYLEIMLELTTPGHNKKINISQYRLGLGKSSPKSNLVQIKEYAEFLKQSVIEEVPVILPILAYYGTDRVQHSAPERRRNFQKVFSRWDCYIGALDNFTNFKRFFQWFDLMEDEERREKVNLHDFNYRLPALQAVRNALTLLIKNYQNPHIATRPLRFVMTDVESQHKELRIEQLSAGYKIMISMVADIASRMAEANPDMENPLYTPGIVLIDEVDLHLHPLWQQTVLSQLHSIFPNVQFIVSTHSPTVLIGALDIAQIVTMKSGLIHSNITLDTYKKYDISLLLLSDLFGLDNVRSFQYDVLSKQRDVLLLKPSLSPEEREKLNELNAQLDSYSTVDSNSIEELLNKYCHDKN